MPTHTQAERSKLVEAQALGQDRTATRVVPSTNRLPRNRDFVASNRRANRRRKRLGRNARAFGGR